MSLDFKALMASKPVTAPDIKPASEIIADTIKEQENKVLKDLNTNTNMAAEIVRIMSDKTISLDERLKLRRQLKEKAAATTKEEQLTKTLAEDPKPVQQFALSIQLNKEQNIASEMAGSGKSFALTGKAGTGKTTALREIARALLENGVLGQHTFGYYKPEVVAHSIAFVAYTNRATDNMRRSIHMDPYLAKEFEYNVLTVHKLLEYTMEWITNAEGKTIPHFYPKRCATNPLDITHLVVEEGSMLDIPLWRQVFEALRPGTVVILVGDINQLPPVFGPSILNYGLVKLPVIELKQVYRQALDSPILSNALKVLEGIFPVPDGKAFKLFQTKPGGKMPTEHSMAVATVNSIKKWIEAGTYDVKTDIMLSPFNKERFPCGTKTLNYHLAQYLGDKRGAKIHQVVAGRNTWYLAEGDRVMIEKQDGVIERIAYNAQFMGKAVISSVCDINRFGKPIGTGAANINEADFELEGYEELNVDDIPDEEKKIAASHYVDVRMDDGRIVSLTSAGDFGDAKFSLGYCLSVHKAQGSEWRKVVLVIHKNFKVLLFRELIYTAMTRAREELVIIDMSNSLDGAIKSQRIKGNTIKEKIEWFNSKLALTEDVPIVP